MESLAPGALAGAAGGGAHIAEHHGLVAHSHRPTLALLSVTAREKIAAEIHERVRAEINGEPIGEPSFGDPAEVDRRALPQTSCALSHREHVGKRGRGSADRHRGWPFAERARVAGGEESRKYRDVDEPAGDLVRAERLAKQPLKDRSHLGPPPGAGVEAGELRRAGEPREPVVHFVDPCFAVGKPPLGKADRVDLALATERLKDPLLRNRHRWK